MLKDTHKTLIGKMSCFTCHTEHQGLGGRISTVLDLAGHRKKIKQELQQDCQQCHLSAYKRAHPNMIKQKCVDCHRLEEPLSFKTQTFRHTEIKTLHIDVHSSEFTKLPYPERGECQDCHRGNFHLGEKTADKPMPSGVEGNFDCFSCHNLNRLSG